MNWFCWFCMAVTLIDCQMGEGQWVHLSLYFLTQTEISERKQKPSLHSSRQDKVLQNLVLWNIVFELLWFCHQWLAGNVVSLSSFSSSPLSSDGPSSIHMKLPNWFAPWNFSCLSGSVYSWISGDSFFFLSHSSTKEKTSMPSHHHQPGQMQHHWLVARISMIGGCQHFLAFFPFVLLNSILNMRQTNLYTAVQTHPVFNLFISE